MNNLVVKFEISKLAPGLFRHFILFFQNLSDWKVIFYRFSEVGHILTSVCHSDISFQSEISPFVPIWQELKKKPKSIPFRKDELETSCLIPVIYQITDFFILNISFFQANSFHLKYMLYDGICPLLYFFKIE